MAIKMLNDEKVEPFFISCNLIINVTQEGL